MQLVAFAVVFKALQKAITSKRAPDYDIEDSFVELDGCVLAALTRAHGALRPRGRPNGGPPTIPSSRGIDAGFLQDAHEVPERV